MCVCGRECVFIYVWNLYLYILCIYVKWNMYSVCIIEYILYVQRMYRWNMYIYIE